MQAKVLSQSRSAKGGRPSATPNRAVLYCRVSTKEQTHNLSLKTQEKQCRDYAARFGLTVDRVFVEEGESAKTTQRTQFKAMLQFCRENKGRVHQVIVYSISRFARSAHDHLSVRQQLSQLGISLRSVTEPFDDTSSGKLMESILASFAQFDNDVRAERTVAGMQAAIEKGRWPFKPPIGYLAGSKVGPSIIPDPDRAALVREAFELFARGTSTQRDVLEHATNRGLKTAKGKPLTLQTFNQLLRRPVYAGVVEVKAWGGPVRGDFKPVVRQEVFDSVQAILAGNRPTVTPYLRNHPEFPLRQSVKCGGCGRTLTGSFSTGRAKKRYPYYHCPNRECKVVSVRKEELENAFVEYLKGLQPKPEYVRLFREIVLDVWRERQQQNLTTTVQLEQKVEELQNRKEQLDEAFIYAKAIDRATYERQKDKLSEDLMLAEMELRETKTTESDIEGVLNFAEHVILNASRLWVEFNLDQKQRFQRVLFPNGLTFLDGEFGTTATCLIFNLLQPSPSLESRMATLRGFEPRLPP